MSAQGFEHFTYHHVPSKSRRTIFLLHGTGGDQFDLLPIVEPVQNQFQVVSLLGNVREHGLPRFFARFPSGDFDVKSIEVEAKKLNEFVLSWCGAQNISPIEIVFVGYSNGANMIMALAQLYPNIVHKAVILHGLLPLDREVPDMSQKSFLVTYGESDTMIPAQKTKDLVVKLERSSAKVETVVHAGGHEFRLEEQVALLRFLQQTNR